MKARQDISGAIFSWVGAAVIVSGIGISAYLTMPPIEAHPETLHDIQGWDSYQKTASRFKGTKPNRRGTWIAAVGTSTAHCAFIDKKRVREIAESELAERRRERDFEGFVHRRHLNRLATARLAGVVAAQLPAQQARPAIRELGYVERLLEANRPLLDASRRRRRNGGRLLGHLRDRSGRDALRARLDPLDRIEVIVLGGLRNAFQRWFGRRLRRRLELRLVHHPADHDGERENQRETCVSIQDYLDLSGTGS